MKLILSNNMVSNDVSFLIAFHLKLYIRLLYHKGRSIGTLQAYMLLSFIIHV